MKRRNWLIGVSALGLRRSLLRDEARRERCQQLMANLGLGSACGRPDIAAYATKLSAEVRAA
jgi:hypothetical protein